MLQKAYSRTHAVRLNNPDFSLLAQAFGMNGDCIHNDYEIDACLERVFSFDKPAIVEVQVSYDVLPPYLKARLETSAKQMPLTQKMFFASRLMKRRVGRLISRNNPS